jgi:SlyX protein
MDLNELENQLIDLQTRFAFQEDTLQALNDVVTDQARHIEQLQALLRQCQQTLEAMREQSAAGEIVDVPPPHY